MDRNQDRIYYDKGYSDGVKDTKRDSRIPKILGALTLLVVTWADVYIAATFFILYAGFEFMEYRDEQRYHESDPPPLWEGE